IQDPNSPRYAPKSKQSPYDGGLRTPIMIRWPDRVKPQRSESLAMSIDFMPTLLNAVGLKPTGDMKGINLLDAKTVRARKVNYGECFTHAAVDLDNPAANLRWRWLIEGDWKLIVPAAQNEPTAHIELYNLANDPHEGNNLATVEPQKVQHLTQLLDRWWSGTQSLQQQRAR
ncbi:MAG: sulfatase/phosphatase domain-containing protein, partial [Verrucomicrobiota bacterium]